MINEWEKCHLNVPLNQQGIIEHETDDLEMPNVDSFWLSPEEYDVLCPVFTKWNKMFDIIIDICEEETLGAEYTREAMEILEKHISESNDSQFLSATAKLKEALAKAVELSMPLYLDF